MARGVGLWGPYDEAHIQGALWTPMHLPGAEAWWDGSDLSTLTVNSGTYVTVDGVVDKTGNGYDLSIASGSGPLYAPNQLNGLSAIEGTGSRQWDQTHDFSSGWSVVTLVNGQTAKSLGCLLGGANDLIPIMGDGSSSTNLIRADNTNDSPSLDMYVDGEAFTGTTRNNVYDAVVTDAEVLVAIRNINTVTNVSPVYGPFGFQFDGYFYEMIVSNNTLTTVERQLLEGYLAWKWGVRLLLPEDHPYINRPPLIGDG